METLKWIHWLYRSQAYQIGQRCWQIKRDSATMNQINHLQRIGFELKKLKNTQWSDTLESLIRDCQSLWKMAKRVMRISDSNLSLQIPNGLACSDSKTAKALEDNVQFQLQPVPVPLLQMDNVQRVREATQSFTLAPASWAILLVWQRSLNPSLRSRQARFQALMVCQIEPWEIFLKKQ